MQDCAQDSGVDALALLSLRGFVTVWYWLPRLCAGYSVQRFGVLGGSPIACCSAWEFLLL